MKVILKNGKKVRIAGRIVDLGKGEVVSVPDLLAKAWIKQGTAKLIDGGESDTKVEDKLLDEVNEPVKRKRKKSKSID